MAEVEKEDVIEFMPHAFDIVNSWMKVTVDEEEQVEKEPKRFGRGGIGTNLQRTPLSQARLTNETKLQNRIVNKRKKNDDRIISEDELTDDDNACSRMTMNRRVVNHHTSAHATLLQEIAARTNKNRKKREQQKRRKRMR